MAAAAVVLMVIDSDRGYRTINCFCFVDCDFDFAACLWKGKLDNYYGQCYTVSFVSRRLWFRIHRADDR